MTNKTKQFDAFEEVAAIFAESGVEITDAMLQQMSPLMGDSNSFKKYRASLAARLNKLTISKPLLHFSAPTS